MGSYAYLNSLPTWVTTSESQAVIRLSKVSVMLPCVRTSETGQSGISVDFVALPEMDFYSSQPRNLNDYIPASRNLLSLDRWVPIGFVFLAVNMRALVHDG